MFTVKVIAFHDGYPPMVVQTDFFLLFSHALMFAKDVMKFHSDCATKISQEKVTK